MSDFIIGDYAYTIYSDTVSVQVVDRTKSSYEDMPDTVEYDNQTYNVVVLDDCFYQCINLIQAPKLSANALSMQRTFRECFSLATIPIISSNVMFLSECFAYTNFTDLSNLILPKSVAGMRRCFMSCTKLEIPPKLPESLNALNVLQCFYGCSSLKRFPSLPACVDNAAQMFTNCSNAFGTLHVYGNVPTDIDSAFYYINNNVYIVPHDPAYFDAWKAVTFPNNVKVMLEPTFDTSHNKRKHTDILTFGGIDPVEDTDKISSHLGISLNGEVYINDNDLEQAVKDINWIDAFEDYEPYFYIEGVSSDTSSVSFKVQMSSGADISLFPNYVEPVFEYSYDKEFWQSYTLGTSLTIGRDYTYQRVYFRGDNLSTWNDYYISDGIHYDIWLKCDMVGSSNSQCIVGGNILSLRYSNPSMKSTLPCKSAFANLFSSCSTLVSAERLILPNHTTEACYQDMFNGCVNLIKAPKLPAMKVEWLCYGYMFANCINLIKAPELPATTLSRSCYVDMFYHCIHLQIPPKLPATVLAPYCYQSMFEQCYDLQIPPKLPALVLGECCYNRMFTNCQHLTKIPKLPATVLSIRCYKQMFTNVKMCVTATEECIYSYSIPASSVDTESLADMFSNEEDTGYVTPATNTVFYINVPSF